VGGRALKNGVEVPILDKPANATSNSEHSPQPQHDDQVDMVNVQVDLGGSTTIKAMVDTGCWFPMSLPSFMAKALVDRGLAVHTIPAKSMLADGKVQDVDVILIETITVDGRALHDVVAAVGPSVAPVLLGLGALNQLGPFKIDNGRLVFTGEQKS
jgi:predicted aspartyl protease